MYEFSESNAQLAEEEEDFLLSSAWEVKKINSYDGNRLRVASVKGRGRDGLVFLGGRSEFIEKYNYFLKEIVQTTGRSIFTLDHRGQGESGGIRSHIDSYDTYAEDLFFASKNFCQNRQYSIVAHSMGGLIALYAVLQGLLQPERIILCSPLLGIPDRIFSGATNQRLAKIMTFFRFNEKITPIASSSLKFADNPLTHSPSRFVRIKKSPYHPISPTWGWVNAVCEAVAKIFAPESLLKLKVPVNILIPEDERVVDPEAALRFYEEANKYAKNLVHLEMIPYSRHELLSENPWTYRIIVDKIIALL